MGGYCRHRSLFGVALAVSLILSVGCTTSVGHKGTISVLGRCSPGSVWVVRAGDTLSEIAQRCRVPTRLLARHNQIDPPYMIRIGQRIHIPSRVVRAQTEKTPQRPVLTLHLPLQAAKRWIRDGKGRHSLFFPTEIGRAVRAAAAGKVEAVTQLPLYGRVVLVSHPGGYISVYAYLLKAQVQLGQHLKAGNVLGYTGVNPQTGEPGLYFELRYGKRQVDLKRWHHWAK